MGERCKTCVHDSKPWYEEPCDSCCGAHSGYEPINLQPTCNQLATDCISRQAAIDAIMELIEEPEDDFNEGVRTSAAVLLNEVPSAQHKPLKYSGESICVFCRTTNCDGCLYEPMEGVKWWI